MRPGSPARRVVWAGCRRTVAVSQNCGRPRRDGHRLALLMRVRRADGRAESPATPAPSRYSLSGVSAPDPLVVPSPGIDELFGDSGVSADAGAGVTWTVNSWLTARPLSGPPGMSIRKT